MRFPSAAAVLPILVAVGGQVARAQLPNERLFVVECRMTTTAVDGQKEVQLGPRLTVAEGRTAVINDITQTPIVASVARKRGGEQPRVTVLEEGTKIELTVFGEGNRHATLDATIETSKIAEIRTKAIDDERRRQCARVEARRLRVMELTALGDEFVVPLAGLGRDATRRTIEFAVYSPDMPRHWYDKSETDSPRSWLSRLFLVLLRALAAE